MYFYDQRAFVLAELEGEYFRIKPDVVGTQNTFYFHKDIAFRKELFVASRGISILRKIDRLVSADVYIGGPMDGAMPIEAYSELIKKFPNSYELDRYADARVGACLADYFDGTHDAERLYNQYINKKFSSKGSRVLDVFRDSEISKYRTLLEKLEIMLNPEDSYSEQQWQAEILDFILLLYPKYIAALPNVEIKDSVAKKNRYIDFMLVDSNGNVDIIEIKRPFAKAIVSWNRYRENYIPLRELSGTIMQMEKYLFHPSKWGHSGEAALTNRYRSRLPEGLHIKIVNPKGIVIMGRDNNLNSDQRADFEIIRRKYTSVIDIITYDDLLKRLKFTISQLERDEVLKL